MSADDDFPYFGGCPFCGDTDGYMNVGSQHWFTCDKHATRWFSGSNLFSCWKDETEADWEKNRTKLEGYTNVNPVRARDEVLAIGDTPTRPDRDYLSGPYGPVDILIDAIGAQRFRELLETDLLQQQKEGV